MVALFDMQQRLVKKYRRYVGYRVAKKCIKKTSSTPYISFSFDDFPRSAFLNGAQALEEYGVYATYFVSMGLLNAETPVGRIATLDDLCQVEGAGHELGCHTFDHFDGWSTRAKIIEQSIMKNRRVIQNIFPGKQFRTFAYPVSGPRARTKRIVGKHFLCCRGGGQTFNRKKIDLYLLKGYFLDWRNRNDINSVKKLIDQNNIEGGWLVFASHDIRVEPSPYGCTPKFFLEVVRYAKQSGAVVLPVAKTCDRLSIHQQYALGAASNSRSNFCNREGS
jgi:peptidoglycan/xylan/chitin deacetylase (PgdA/CDA1 family)